MKLLTIEILALFILFGCVREDFAEPNPQTRTAQSDGELSSDYYWFRDQKFYLTPINKSYKLFRAEGNAAAPSFGGSVFSKHPMSAQMDSTATIYAGVIQNGPTKSSLVGGLKEIYTIPCFKNEEGAEVKISNLFFVILKDASDEEYLKELAESNGVKVLDKDFYMPLFYTLACDNASRGNALEMTNLFHETERFDAVAPNFLGWETASNDPLYNMQWNMRNTGQTVETAPEVDQVYSATPGIDIGYEAALPYIPASSDVIVAVIDSGVETDHPDLNVYDSWDAESGTSPCKVYSKHGTRCAGVIGAIANNGIGLAGIAPNVKLMAISVDIYGMGVYERSMSRAIDYAVNHGADVISCSWGGDYSEVIDKQLRNALKNGRGGKGCIIVCASGNRGWDTAMYFPATSNPDYISVGAVNPNGVRAVETWYNGGPCWGSNYGELLDIVAPGTGICTTDLEGTFTTDFSMTSSACPHVAGVAALLLSIDPSLTHRQVSDIIEMTAKKVGSYSYESDAGRPNGGWNREMGYGMLNAGRAAMATQPFVVVGDKTFPTDVEYFGQRLFFKDVAVVGYAKLNAVSVCGKTEFRGLLLRDNALVTSVTKGATILKDIRTEDSSAIDSSSEDSTTLEYIVLTENSKLTASAPEFTIKTDFSIAKGSEMILRLNN